MILQSKHFRQDCFLQKLEFTLKFSKHYSNNYFEIILMYVSYIKHQNKETHIF